MRCTIRETGPTTVLGRALTLLECFADGDDEFSLAELSRRGGLSKATAYRLAKELCDWRYLERTETGLRLGSRMFELGSQVRPYAELRASSQSILRELSASTGRCVHLAVLDESHVVYVDKIEPPTHRLGLPSRIGGRMPAHCTALGKALLAQSPAAAVRSVLTQELRRRTPRTVVAPGLLEKELIAVRQRGAAFDCEEAMVGISCAATPFRADGNRGWAAVSVSGRTAGNRELHRMAEAVHTSAARLSQALRPVS
jgi:DNA-binding IclR family transcriptional regulator